MDCGLRNSRRVQSRQTRMLVAVFFIIIIFFFNATGNVEGTKTRYECDLRVSIVLHNRVQANTMHSAPFQVYWLHYAL